MTIAKNNPVIVGIRASFGSRETMSTSELKVPQPPHGKGHKERSRDMLAMEGRLAKVELAFADMRDRFEDVNQRIKKLEFEGGDE